MITFTIFIQLTIVRNLKINLKANKKAKAKLSKAVKKRADLKIKFHLNLIKVIA
jgi:ABC-type uncharacterized transport system ATPase subunit